MKRSVLPLLACPAPAAAERCGGSLTVIPLSGVSIRDARLDPDELLEGAVRCGRCGTTYPVLSGVAVLAPDPEKYVRRYHNALTRDLARHGGPSPDAERWLRRQGGREAGRDDYGADFRFTQQFERPWDVARALSPDPAALYGGFADWLRDGAGRGPYDVLAGWAEELPVRHLALDAGCGGGGLVARVAPLFQAVFGVDLSFLAVLLARRAVLHRPEPERTYLLSVRRGHEEERPLALPRAENAEIVVGDCSAVPFAPGLFDAVCSSNVIDIAGLEPPLDEAARVLRPGGTLLLSDPFYFRDGEAPAREPRAAVRAALEARSLRIEKELDGVPWAWATYDRHWRLYFNYCLAARRGGGG